MEVVTLVGGALLAPVFESLFNSLKSSDLLNFARESGVIKELSKLEKVMEAIYVVLNDAEEKQRTNDGVKIWFNDLRNLAYDVEDILEEFNTEARIRKFCARSKASSSKVRKLIAKMGLKSRPKFNNRMIGEVKNVYERFEKIKDQIGILKLSVDGSNSRVKEVVTTSITSSVVNEADVYGREDDRKTILDQLKVEAGDGRMRVIPIVGMGGLGKTTLAQLVYNDSSLQFDFKSWVTVGQSFDVLTITKTITKAILQQFGRDLPEDLSRLQAKLKEKLSGKKALIVLDDVWITKEEYHLWSLFTTPFKEGTPGSRILVTTRNRSVAHITSTTDGYDLQGLSIDNCLSILANNAFERKDFNAHPHLKELGVQIAKRCDGLPLAAEVLGGVLRGKQDISSWEEVANSKIWEEGKSVLQALQLSYYHLPPHLKRCFGYTAIFPKHHGFDKTELVSFWMAEGFVEHIKDGYKYFEELLARSFFQKSSYGASLADGDEYFSELFVRSFFLKGSSESLYVMHDLINDLARSVSEDFCFNLDEEVGKLGAKVRYSAFFCHKYERFERFHEMKHLRTLLPLKRRDFWHLNDDYLSPTVLDVIFKKLGWLRVLALPYAISELPASIDCLKHLRCLDLSNSQIVMLPESLCELFNLIALILFRCKELRELPKGFCDLINLQFLDIRDTDKLEEIPLSIGELKNLHILGKFVVGKSHEARMLDLLKIPNLQVRQHISALENVKNVKDVESWKMGRLEGIDGLTLEWVNRFDDSRSEKNEKEVLNALKPQKNIMELSINSYGGRESPSWIGDPSFGKMKILELKKCYKVSSLPALGRLPSLEELTLEGMDEIKAVGMTFYGNIPSSTVAFPSLKILRIENMGELYEWSTYCIDEGRERVFPNLKKLYLTNCPKLEECSFPFPNLDELIVSGCKEVVLRSLRNLQPLKKLEIESIAGLESFNKALLEVLMSLQEMRIRNCGELKHLWEDEFNVDRLGCLKKLVIYDCKELVSLVEEEGNFLFNLRDLDVERCNKLKKLPNQLHSVKSVKVRYCDSLVSLPEGILIKNNVDSNSRHMSQIEELIICYCEALNLPSNLCFPASLSELVIGRSPVGAQLCKSLQLQNGFSHLTFLRIFSCHDLDSFPDATPPIPTLLYLNLHDCNCLRSLPNSMNKFTSLQTLEMCDCPEVASFPEGGLPTNLKRLGISYCDKLESKVFLEQSLSALTCLERLKIEVGGGMDDFNSFPPDSLLLPTSLTSLTIRGFRNLKSISSGIQRLVSLEELKIAECPQLQSLLGVDSLGRLEIYKCPILEEQCREMKGDFWNIAASIPEFEINSEGYLYFKPERLWLHEFFG